MKIKLKLIATVLVFVLSFSLLGCGIDTGYMRINLNGGNYTEAYMAEKNYSSTNVTAGINKAYFEGACGYLPDAEDMIAPSGKVFAGWYFTKETTPDSYFTEENYLNAYKDVNTTTVYARWIDEGNINVVLDLNNSGADYTDAYRQSKGGFTYKPYQFVISASNLQAVVDALPTASEVQHTDENYGFRGWYLDIYYQKEVTVENLTELLSSQSSAVVQIYGWWDYGYRPN